MVKFDFDSYPSPYFRYGVIISLCFSFVCLFLIAISWAKLPPEIPLFYSRPWGEEILAPPFFIFVMPVASFLVLGINLFIALTLSQNRFLGIILISAASFFSFLALFNTLKIITLIA